MLQSRQKDISRTFQEDEIEEVDEDEDDGGKNSRSKNSGNSYSKSKGSPYQKAKKEDDEESGIYEEVKDRSYMSDLSSRRGRKRIQDLEAEESSRLAKDYSRVVKE